MRSAWLGSKSKIMREIKFRGLSDTGNWYYGGIIPHYTTGYSLITDPEGNDASCKNGTIGQFTGLQDKKRNDIYEGDILTDKDKNTTIVVWISEWAMFGCMFHDEWELYRMRGVKEIDESMFWTFPIENTQYKVIGNIHENSDLFSERSVKADA